MNFTMLACSVLAMSLTTLGCNKRSYNSDSETKNTAVKTPEPGKVPDTVYVGVDQAGKPCSVNIEEDGALFAHINTDVNGNSLPHSYLFSKFIDEDRCSESYTNTPEKIIIKNMDWEESGYIKRFTMYFKDMEYTVELGAESISKNLACAYFAMSRDTYTCSKLVLQTTVLNH